MRWSVSRFVARAATRLILSACVVLMGGPAHAAPTILSGPIEVHAPGDQRQTPALIALVADADRLGGANNDRDLFQIVALTADLDAASATILAVLPDQQFSYRYPPQVQSRASALAVSADGRYLWIALSKSLDSYSSVVLYAYSVALDDDGRTRLEPITDGPRVADSPTVACGLSAPRASEQRGPIRFIHIEPAGDIVRVELRIAEEDDAPIVYEVRSEDWSARQVGQNQPP